MNVQNNAGTRITITWRDGIKETDIDEGAKGEFTYNITSYVKNLPQYNFMMVRYGTNISELVNMESVIMVHPTTEVNAQIATYTVTSSGIKKN